MFGLVVLLAASGTLLRGAEPDLTRDAVIAELKPFDGKGTKLADGRELSGKVMCGYQGWFAAEGDGSGRGWQHYTTRREFRPGSCSIDLWPDVSELDADEKFATPFRHADGRVAHVFSSTNRKTIERHFRWMKEYRIDGAFVQRFAVETVHPHGLRHFNTVLSECRAAANLHERAYAVMYDLTGLGKGGTQVVIDDWKLLVDKMRIGQDENDGAYLHHHGKPLVAVWGIGFSDGRQYTLAECERLVDFLRHDPMYGGSAVMLGVPSGWRTLEADSMSDEALHGIIRKADIVSPWTVGRYATLKDIESHAERRWKPDLAWCREEKKGYLPVVFPGFSWHNLRPKSPLDQIPRQEGKFLWKQFVELKSAGAGGVYVAMFDELDEGTAIFKCTSDVPVGASRFVTFGDLPSDHYLWLTGQGRALLRGSIAPSSELPVRTTARK